MNRKQSNRDILTELFFRLLPYQILLSVISAVNGIVDSLYASNALGKTAMSAIGLYGPFNHFFYAMSILLVAGSQILYGRYVSRERERVHGLFSTDMIFSAVISALAAVLLTLMATTGVTGRMASNPEDLKQLNVYIYGQAIGIPALVLGQQLFAFLSLENQTKRTMIASIACFLSHIVFNHLFVVILPLGIFGLGLSTSLANWLFFFIQAWFYISKKSEWRFSLKSLSLQEGGQILVLGYPGAIARFMEMFRCLIVNGLIQRYVGSDGLSAFAASNSVMSIFWAVPFGMVAVSRMLFSISIGEEDRRSLIDSMRIALTKGQLLLLAVVAFLILTAEPATRLFYRDPADEVFRMTVMGLRILPLCMPLAQISVHFTSYAQNIGRKKLAVVLPIIDGMVGVVVCSFVLIPLMKMNGLYIANVLNGVICCLVIVVSAWIALKRFPRSLEDLMVIPEDFGAADDERIDITVRDMDQALDVSRQVMDFCTLRGIDRRRAFFAGLCMEEMAGNIITHGFSKDEKENAIDIRVVHRGDEIILQLRDNCVAFNPSERFKPTEPQEAGKDVGIRLVYSIAGEVSYQNLLGLNVLTIRI